MSLANHYNCLLTTFGADALWPMPFLHERGISTVLQLARKFAAAEKHVVVVER